MKFAVDTDGKRIQATVSGARANEPGTNWPVVAKVGEVMMPHWARLPGGTPDPWSEPETEWHRTWKERLVPDDWQEYTFPGGQHRADAIGAGGVVVEFQHSSIDPLTIRARETYYLAHAKGLVWVFDAQGWALDKETLLKAKDGKAIEIRWRSPRMSLFEVSCPMYLDVGNGMMFEVQHISTASPYTVTVLPIKTGEFVATFGVAAGTPFEAPSPPPGKRGPSWSDRNEAERLKAEKARAELAAYQANEQKWQGALTRANKAATEAQRRTVELADAARQEVTTLRQRIRELEADNARLKVVQPATTDGELRRQLEQANRLIAGLIEGLHTIHDPKMVEVEPGVIAASNQWPDAG